MFGKYHVYVIALEEPAEVDISYNRKNERITNAIAVNSIEELVEEGKKILEDTKAFVLTKK